MAALQKIVNLFRGNSDAWSVEKGGNEQTLSRPTYNEFGKKTGGRHTHREFKNSVRNPEARGIFNDTKAPFTEIIATERNLSRQQQRQRIRDEILVDCQGSNLYKNPVGIFDINAKTNNGVTLDGQCDAGNGRVHAGEYNEFDTCGSKDVYNSVGVKIGSVANRDADCLIAPAQGAHFRTIIGRQRDDAGNSHTVIEDRLTAPTLVNLREGEVFGNTMTQFHYLQGLKDERSCARHGYMCGY